MLNQHSKKCKRQRAIALITALVVLTFVMLLTGALVQIQNSAFAIAQSSDSRVRSRAACRSLYDYCLYQVEHNRDWGKGGFVSLEAIDPARATNEANSSLDSRVEIKSFQGTTFSGYLPDHQASFEVEVVNSLDYHTSGLKASDGNSVKTEQLRLIITAWDGKEAKAQSRSAQTLDCLLRLAPLFDGSILSRGNVTIDAENVLFASKDRFRNEIRSEHDMSLKGLTEGKVRFIKHSDLIANPSTALKNFEADSSGLLWAKGDIKDGITKLAGEELVEAAENSSAQLVNKANSRADIYDLKPENLPRPDNLKTVTIPSGKFQFNNLPATVEYQKFVPDSDGGHWENRSTSMSVNVAEYYDQAALEQASPNTPASPQRILFQNPAEYSQFPYQNPKVTFDVPESDFAGITFVEGRRFSIDASFNDSIIGQTTSYLKDSDSKEMGFRSIDSDKVAPIVIDPAARTIIVQPKTKISPTNSSSSAPGIFKVTARNDSGVGISSLPTIQLGKSENDVVIESEGDLTLGTASDPENPDPNHQDLVTTGGATFISTGGNVEISPSTRNFSWLPRMINNTLSWVTKEEAGQRDFEFKAAEDYSGLVVYADKNVTINGSSSDANWDFRGFIYARGKFDYKTGKGKSTFYGSVISGTDLNQEGDFNIKSRDRNDQVGGRVVFVYDPDYLKLLTRELSKSQSKKQNWTRVEPVIWSEGNG